MPLQHFDPPMEICPLCGSPALSIYDQDYKKIKIDRCNCCHLMFMNPQYTDDYLNNYYSTYINSDQRTGKESAEKHQQKQVAFELLTSFKQGGRFLSIGCGSGLELEMARDLGFVVEGYDVDPQTTMEVSQRVGVTIHCGDFAELNLPDAQYDCLFLDQVLEHPKDPAGYLRQIWRLLKQDGVVYIGVPNIASFSAQLKTLQGRLGLKKRRRGKHYDTDHHLFYYRPEVLKGILEREFQFEVLALVGDPRVNISPVRNKLARRFPVLCSRFVIVARPQPR